MGFEPFPVIAKTLDFDGGFGIQPRDLRLLFSECCMEQEFFTSIGVHAAVQASQGERFSEVLLALSQVGVFRTKPFP